jgi:hypothetical protein
VKGPLQLDFLPSLSGSPMAKQGVE